jgi:hypothetical protein
MGVPGSIPGGGLPGTISGSRSSNAQEAIKVDPDSNLGYFHTALAYLGLNRIDEAKAVLKAGLAHNPDFGGLHEVLADVALVQGDLGTMEKEKSLAKSHPDSELGFILHDAMSTRSCSNSACPIL